MPRGDYFVTSNLQYDFKKRVGCHHALYTVKYVVQFNCEFVGFRCI